MNKNVNMGTSQGLSLLLQGLTCIPRGMLQTVIKMSYISMTSTCMHVINKQDVHLLQ